MNFEAQVGARTPAPRQEPTSEAVFGRRRGGPDVPTGDFRIVQARDRERVADRAAARAMNRVGSTIEGKRSVSVGEDPKVSFAAVRAPLEMALGHDFSRVRIHARGPASDAARGLGARALTYGDEVAFAPGEWAPGTGRGLHLLAHELAHVAAQAGEGARRLDAKTLDEEVDEELAKHVAGDAYKTTDPTREEYARTLQGYGFGLTHKDMTSLIDEPKDPKLKAEYERKFKKAGILAGRILDKSGSKVQDKESRAQMLTSDLATAGFVSDAMALARRFTNNDMRVLVYAAALDRPDKVTQAELVEITKFSLAKSKLADHQVAKKFDDSGVYTKKLPADTVNAVLAELVTTYSSEAKLPETLARIIFFDNRLQAGFTAKMLEKKQGSLLRKVSEQAYFAAGAQITTATNQTLRPSDAAVAWAIGNRQKVTVEDIVKLVTDAGDKITRPAKFDAATLRAWLEANTEKIGQALKKQHPNDPEVAEAMLKNITSSFMWHVDPDQEDIKPDKSGHIQKLSAASGGQKNQLKVDCDVLATYNVRLLTAAGFTPIGYLAVVPTDKGRAAHAMALMQQGQTYRALSNTETKNFPVPKAKDDALKQLRDFGLGEAYDASRPITGYKIYYQDSPTGALPDAVLNFDVSALQSGLSKP